MSKPTIISKQKPGYLDILFFKYACVGVMNTIFGYSTFTLLIMSGLHYQIAVIVGTILSIFFNFKTIGKIVFKNKNNMLVFKFLLVYIIIATLNITFLDLEIKMKINVYLAGALLLVPLGTLSFVLNKTLVFKGHELN